ncbi:MAG: WD40 repeat domain-containing protein [Lachnospiraceae bacterium]|nr:WD40 repeat domain-containing protein [Lachnospiraceae bacterium]
MRKFWGFYDNGTYRVGCNGSSIYVYDQNNRELNRFKDIKYAYVGVFQPGTNIFVAKSTEGSLAIYDLDRSMLLKKIVITQNGAQDEGIAFSPDGKLLYNIEKPLCSTRTQLTVYQTSDYSVYKTLFADEARMHLEFLEFGKNGDNGYMLGFMRDESGIFEYGFIGRFAGENITEMQRLNREEYAYIQAYKVWEQSGYTEKKLEWSSIKKYSERPHISLEQGYRLG